jgi:hypothetical protein
VGSRIVSYSGFATPQFCTRLKPLLKLVFNAWNPSNSRSRSILDHPPFLTFLANQSEPSLNHRDMEIRELRGNRSYQQAPPLIQGTRRGIHLQTRRVMAIRGTAQATPPTTMHQPTMQTPGLLVSHSTSFPTPLNAIDERSGDPEEVGDRPVTQIEQADSPSGTPAPAWDRDSVDSAREWGLERGDDASQVHLGTEEMSFQVFILHYHFRPNT